MKATQKKNDHLVNDLKLLVQKLDLTRRYDTTLANRKNFDFTSDDKSSLKFYCDHDSLYARERTAIKKWKKIPKRRRDRAVDLYRIAFANATLALDLGGNKLGESDRKIIWRGRTGAKTILTSDDGGGGVAHIVRLEAADVVLMEKVPNLLASSVEKGLPVIAVFRVPRNQDIFRATWVTHKAGEIKGVEGWIAYDSVRNLIGHSTLSAANAKESLRWIVTASELNKV